MTFKSFCWLVLSPNTQKKKNLTWVNMWLGSSVKYNPYIFPFAKTPKCWPKILKQRCIDNRLISKKLLSEIAEVE